MRGGKLSTLSNEGDPPAKQSNTIHQTDIAFLNCVVFLYLNNQPHVHCENKLVLYNTENQPLMVGIGGEADESITTSLL